LTTPDNEQSCSPEEELKIMEQKSVVGNYKAQWGEGPIWVKNALVYVDIEKHQILRHTPSLNREESWDVGERVGTVVPREQGGFVFAGDKGFSFLDEISGKVTPIFDPEKDKANNRFNDGKCAPDGSFFAGSISLVKKQGDASLYRLGVDLSVTEVYPGVTNSNGIIWNAAGDTMFYIDTPRREIVAFDYRNGLLLNERKVVDTKHIDASPDGMTIDTEGNLWTAFCHGA
jgi:sugar lactone lactonase YvrE